VLFGQLAPLAAAYTGVVLVPARAMRPNAAGLNYFNGRSLAHELAHILVGTDCTVPSPSCNVDDASHVTEAPNILRGGAEHNNSVLKKRFNKDQRDRLLNANPRVRYPGQ